MNTHRDKSMLGAMTLAAVIVVFAAGFLVCGSALALKTHLAIEPPIGPFASLEAMTVDQATGNLYVGIENGPHIVKVFGPEGGAPVGGVPSSFTGEDTPTKAFTPFSDFAASGGDLYMAEVGASGEVVLKLALQGAHEDNEFICEFTGIGLTEPACGGAPETRFNFPRAVAVDTSGDVYIADSEGSNPGVYEFNAAGEEVRVFKSTLLLAPRYIAVSPDGTLYVSNDHNGRPLIEFKRSSQTGEVEGDPEGNVIASGVAGIAFDDASGHLLVNLGSVMEELDGSNEVIESFGEGILDEAEAVAVNEATGDVYVVNNIIVEEATPMSGIIRRKTGSTVQRFGPAVVLADVATGGSKEVGYTTAIVEGTMNPDETKAKYYFQYGAAKVDEHSTTPVSAEGNAELPVSENLTGLQASTVYHYRLVTENEGGTNFGHEETFTTLTAVEGVMTGEATGVSATTAVLNGSLDPNGTEASYYFEYGLTPALGSQTQVVPAGAGGEVPAVATITKLRGNTSYYYRLVATNEHGATVGATRSLLTPTSKPEVLSEIATRIFPREALLRALVNPDGADTTYHFVYGATPVYGSRFPLNDLALEGSGEELQALLSVSGLQPGTTYHYAVVATNAGGTTVGPDQTFTTPPALLPTATTSPVGELSPNAATLSGTIDPRGVPTSYEFDIGTDTTYGSRIFGEAGGGIEPLLIATNVQGLAAGTLYHYRIVATNTYGTVYGADQTFVTPSFPTSSISAPLSTPLVPSPVFAPPSTNGAILPKAATVKAKHKPRKAKSNKKAKKKTKIAKRARKAESTGRAHGRGRGGR